jgi:hypothetical protein
MLGEQRHRNMAPYGQALATRPLRSRASTCMNAAALEAAQVLTACSIERVITLWLDCYCLWVALHAGALFLRSPWSPFCVFLAQHLRLAPHTRPHHGAPPRSHACD